MSAEYFLHEMGPAEAEDFVKGYSRRQRSGWEQMRKLADVVCMVLCGQDSGISFPWENEKPGLTEDEEMKRVEALREWAKKLEEKDDQRIGCGTNDRKSESAGADSKQK